MANSKLPGVSAQEETLLYDKLNRYNQGRASYKEAGAYLIALPRPGKTHFSLWFYSPFTERQPLLYVCNLADDVHEALRQASTMFYYSPRCLFIVSYNEKRMQSNGDDLVAFGKYRGHFLHEVFRIDPAYVGWIAYKFTPRIPKQQRFVKIARAYHTIHLDLMMRRTREKLNPGSFLGEVGDKLENLKLKVRRVRLEDDPYKTRVRDGVEEFYVKQLLTLDDRLGNRVQFSIPGRTPSGTSATLSGLEHAYAVGEIVHVESARIVRRYESHGRRYTCLGRVRLYRQPPRSADDGY